MQMHNINSICIALAQIPKDEITEYCQQGQLHRLMAFLVKETPQSIQPVIQILGSDIIEAYISSLAKQNNQLVDLSLPQQPASDSVTPSDLIQSIKRNNHYLYDWVDITDHQRLEYIITLARSLTLSDELTEPDFSQLPTSIKNIVESISRWQIRDLFFLNEDELSNFIGKQSVYSLNVLAQSLDPASINILNNHLDVIEKESIKISLVGGKVSPRKIFSVHHDVLQQIILTHQQNPVSFKLERLNQYLAPFELNDFEWKKQVTPDKEYNITYLKNKCDLHREECLQSNCVFWQSDDSTDDCILNHYQHIFIRGNDWSDRLPLEDPTKVQLIFQDVPILLSTLLKLTLEQSINLFNTLRPSNKYLIMEYFIATLQTDNLTSLLDDITQGQQDTRKTFATSEITLDLQINQQPDQLKYDWLIQRLHDLACQMTKDQKQQLIEQTTNWPSDVHHEYWFQLEDIADDSFSDRWMQSWLRDCSNVDLIIIFHDLGDHPLKEKVLVNVSKRAADMLIEDIEMASRFSRAEIQQARHRLMQAARHTRSYYQEE
jgi:hypothetical protein